MTLSLDDVRNKRFRMARKSGYEVLEVDEFVDDVEATFAQLFEENQNLKRQVESLKSAPPAPAGATPPAPAPVQQTHQVNDQFFSNPVHKSGVREKHGLRLAIK